MRNIGLVESKTHPLLKISLRAYLSGSDLYLLMRMALLTCAYSPRSESRGNGIEGAA